AWLRNEMLDSEPSDLLSHVAFLPFILALWTFFLALFGAYRSPRNTSRLQYTWAVGRAVVVGVVSLLTVLFLLKIQYVSRAVMVTFAALDFLALAGLRLAVVWYFQRSLSQGESCRRVLIVGSGTRALPLARTPLLQSHW